MKKKYSKIGIVFIVILIMTVTVIGVININGVSEVKGSEGEEFEDKQRALYDLAISLVILNENPQDYVYDLLLMTDDYFKKNDRFFTILDKSNFMEEIGEKDKQEELEELIYNNAKIKLDTAWSLYNEYTENKEELTEEEALEIQDELISVEDEDGALDILVKTYSDQYKFIEYYIDDLNKHINYIQETLPTVEKGVDFLEEKEDIEDSLITNINDNIDKTEKIYDEGKIHTENIFSIDYKDNLHNLEPYLKESRSYLENIMSIISDKLKDYLIFEGLEGFQHITNQSYKINTESSIINYGEIGHNYNGFEFPVELSFYAPENSVITVNGEKNPDTVEIKDTNKEGVIKFEWVNNFKPEIFHNISIKYTDNLVKKEDLSDWKQSNIAGEDPIPFKKEIDLKMKEGLKNLPMTDFDLLLEGEFPSFTSRSLELYKDEEKIAKSFDEFLEFKLNSNSEFYLQSYELGLKSDIIDINFVEEEENKIVVEEFVKNESESNLDNMKVNSYIPLIEEYELVEGEGSLKEENGELFLVKDEISSEKRIDYVIEGVIDNMSDFSENFAFELLGIVKEKYKEVENQVYDLSEYHIIRLEERLREENYNIKTAERYIKDNKYITSVNILYDVLSNLKDIQEYIDDIRLGGVIVNDSEWVSEGIVTVGEDETFTKSIVLLNESSNSTNYDLNVDIPDKMEDVKVYIDNVLVENNKKEDFIMENIFIKSNNNRIIRLEGEIEKLVRENNKESVLNNKNIGIGLGYNNIEINNTINYSNFDILNNDSVIEYLMDTEDTNYPSIHNIYNTITSSQETIDMDFSDVNNSRIWFEKNKKGEEIKPTFNSRNIIANEKTEFGDINIVNDNTIIQTFVINNPFDEKIENVKFKPPQMFSFDGEYNIDTLSEDDSEFEISKEERVYKDNDIFEYVIDFDKLDENAEMMIEYEINNNTENLIIEEISNYWSKHYKTFKDLEYNLDLDNENNIFYNPLYDDFNNLKTQKEEIEKSIKNQEYEKSIEKIIKFKNQINNVNHKVKEYSDLFKEFSSKDRQINKIKEFSNILTDSVSDNYEYQKELKENTIKLRNESLELFNDSQELFNDTIKNSDSIEDINDEKVNDSKNKMNQSMEKMNKVLNNFHKLWDYGISEKQRLELFNSHIYQLNSIIKNTIISEYEGEGYYNLIDSYDKMNDINDNLKKELIKTQLKQEKNDLDSFINHTNNSLILENDIINILNEIGLEKIYNNLYDRVDKLVEGVEVVEDILEMIGEENKAKKVNNTLDNVNQIITKSEQKLDQNKELTAVIMLLDSKNKLNNILLQMDSIINEWLEEWVIQHREKLNKSKTIVGLIETLPTNNYDYVEDYTSPEFKNLDSLKNNIDKGLDGISNIPSRDNILEKVFWIDEKVDLIENILDNVENKGDKEITYLLKISDDMNNTLKEEDDNLLNIFNNLHSSLDYNSELPKINKFKNIAGEISIPYSVNQYEEDNKIVNDYKNRKENIIDNYENYSQQKPVNVNKILNMLQEYSIITEKIDNVYSYNQEIKKDLELPYNNYLNLVINSQNKAKAKIDTLQDEKMKENLFKWYNLSTSLKEEGDLYSSLIYSEGLIKIVDDQLYEGDNDTNNPPTAKLNIDIKEKENKFIVNTDASESVAKNDKKIINYEWYFENKTDNFIEGDKKENRVYKKEGEYKILLKITDSEGSESKTESIINLKENNSDYSLSPIIDLDININQNKDNFEVIYDASDSYSSQNKITDYYWSFENKTKNIKEGDEKEKITYNKEGSYDYYLRIVDDNNKDAIKEGSITLEKDSKYKDIIGNPPENDNDNNLPDNPEEDNNTILITSIIISIIFISIFLLIFMGKKKNSNKEEDKENIFEE